MCGIVGYVGQREAAPVLIEGLRRLEYRGYDSAGVATVTGCHLHLRKRAGRIASLAAHLEQHPAPGTTGIGHTRWATHGPANDRNAHPHLGGDGVVAVVHNGVIENYAALKKTASGRRLRLSQRHRHRGDRPPDRQPAQRRGLVGAVTAGAAAAQGHLWPGRRQPAGAGRAGRRPPGQPAGARHRRRRMLPGQRPHALAGFAQKVVYLHDHQVCVLTADDWQILDRGTRRGVGLRPRPESGRGGIRHRRLRAFHAQGDPRAARSAGKRPARPARRERRHGPLRRPQPRRAATPPGRPHRHDGVRHQLPCGPGRRVPVRGVRPHPGRGRVRQRVPLPQPAAGPQHHRAWR